MRDASLRRMLDDPANVGLLCLSAHLVGNGAA